MSASIEDSKEISIEMEGIEDRAVLHDETPSEKLYDWTPNEFRMLRSAYERLSLNSARLLETAKSCKYKESTMQYIIVLLGLASSFIAALPGINETIRAYFTSSFTLFSALLGGLMSKKAYGQKAGKYYSAYQEYKDVLTLIDNIIVSLKSDRDFQSFNYMVAKIETKYEIILPIDRIDEQKIMTECNHKFQSLDQRFAEVEREKIRQKYKVFIDRKSYIYLHECKLSLYRQYAYTEKFEKKAPKLFGCYEYEDWCRIHYPDRYKEFTRIYDRYIKAQTERFFLANGDYNAARIDLEITTRRLMSLPERDFTRMVHEKFIEFQNRIRDQLYTESDREPRSTENYSLDFNE